MQKFKEFHEMQEFQEPHDASHVRTVGARGCRLASLESRLFEESLAIPRTARTPTRTPVEAL